MQSDFTQSEPPVIAKDKMILKITRAIILTDNYTNKEHEILKTKSLYEVPINEIKTKADIYEVYKDTALGLSEAYQFVQKQLPLPNLTFIKFYDKVL